MLLRDHVLSAERRDVHICRIICVVHCSRPGGRGDSVSVDPRNAEYFMHVSLCVCTMNMLFTYCCFHKSRSAQVCAGFVGRCGHLMCISVSEHT